MAEERHIDAVNSDDTTVLRTLLHTIRGLSPVSTTDYALVSLDED